MAFWKKKGEDLAFPPEEGEIPSLPPLPGEEDLTAPPPLPRETRMRPASPIIPEMSMEAPRMRMPMMSSAPPTVSDKTTVFVRIDKYRDIMRTIETMQAKIDELNSTLNRISTIKQRESEIIDGWHAMLSDAKGKLDEISSKMTKPEA